jgi:hypothetical protein
MGEWSEVEQVVRKILLRQDEHDSRLQNLEHVLQSVEHVDNTMRDLHSNKLAYPEQEAADLAPLFMSDEERIERRARLGFLCCCCV